MSIVIQQKKIGLFNNNGGQSLPENSMNFIRRHSLMDWAVPGATKAPVFVKTSLGERLTVIVAHPRVR